MNTTSPPRRVVIIPAGTLGPRIDHGTRGPASRARPQRLVETSQAGVQQRVMDDCHVIDRMRNCAQLSDRQHAAAVIVVTMHDEAGFEPRQCAGYAPRGWSGGHDDESEEAGAITRFRQLMNGTPRDGVRQTYVSPAAAWGLHALCLGEHPTMRYLGSLQATLTDLAKRWGC